MKSSTKSSTDSRIIEVLNKCPWRATWRHGEGPDDVGRGRQRRRRGSGQTPIASLVANRRIFSSSSHKLRPLGRHEPETSNLLHHSQVSGYQPVLVERGCQPARAVGFGHGRRFVPGRFSRRNFETTKQAGGPQRERHVVVGSGGHILVRGRDEAQHGSGGAEAFWY